MRTGSKGFEIWQVGERIHSIDNPVRLQILQRLEAGVNTLNELVAITGKAKSTLSALHLPPLLESGLVVEVPDTRDARTKGYRLGGQRLGRSDVEPGRLRDAVLRFARSSGALPVATVLQLLDLPGLLKDANQAYVDGLARRLGQLLAPGLAATTHEGAAKELGSLFVREGLGRITYGDGAPRVESTDADVASFLEAVVASALEARFGEASVVVRVPAGEPRIAERRA